MISIQFSKRLMLVGTALNAALLVACGGGGGGGGTSDNPAPGGDPVAVTAQMELEGVVAKGIAKGAKVSVFATTSTGKKAGLLGTAVTSATGGYSLKFANQTNPMLVEADLEGADIEDEAAPAGTTFKGKAGQKMRCAINGNGKTKQTANVTPFSEMAAAMASSRGGADTYSAVDVDAAHKKVRDLVIDDHVTASAATLKSKLTTVAQFVKKEHAGDLTAALAALGSGARFDPAKNGFVVDGALAQKIAASCEGSTCATESNFANTVLAETAVAPGGQVTALNAVKALFQDLLDTVGAYNNAAADAGNVKAVGDRLRDAVEAATMPVDVEMLELLGTITRGINWYEARKADPTNPVNLTNFINTFTNSNHQLPGGFVFGRVATINTNGTPVSPGNLPKYQCELAVTGLVVTPGGTDAANYSISSSIKP